MEKCSNFINNINILFDVIRIKSSDGLGRSCPKNFKFFNILKGGYTIAKRPTKKELAEMERQRQAERLQNKRADSKKLLIESLSSLRNTLRYSKNIKASVTFYLGLGSTHYKEVYELAEEIQELNNKLERFL